MRDYHIHTDHSFDSVAKMEDYCQRAVELGLAEVAFMEHFDLNPKDESTGYFQVERYMADIHACRARFGDRLKITAGLELGEPHEYHETHEAFKKGKELELFIGSVHFVGGDVIHRTYEEWETMEKISLDYFAALKDTVRTENFNILGHIDVIKRYIPEDRGQFSPLDFREVIEEILQDVVKSNLAVEVNSSGVRQRFKEPLPALDILRWYRSLGGDRVVFGSDAHRVEHLAGDYQAVEAMVREIGFPRFRIWQDGEWK